MYCRCETSVSKFNWQVITCILMQMQWKSIQFICSIPLRHLNTSTRPAAAWGWLIVQTTGGRDEDGLPSCFYRMWRWVSHSLCFWDFQRWPDVAVIGNLALTLSLWQFCNVTGCLASKLSIEKCCILSHQCKSRGLSQFCRHKRSSR